MDKRIMNLVWGILIVLLGVLLLLITTDVISSMQRGYSGFFSCSVFLYSLACTFPCIAHSFGL